MMGKLPLLLLLIATTFAHSGGNRHEHTLEKVRQKLRGIFQLYGLPVPPEFEPEYASRKRDVSWYGCSQLPTDSLSTSYSLTFLQEQLVENLEIQCVDPDDACGVSLSDLYTWPVCSDGSTCRSGPTADPIFYNSECPNCICYAEPQPGDACAVDSDCEQSYPLNYNRQLRCDRPNAKCIWMYLDYSVDPAEWAPLKYSSPGDTCVVDENCYGDFQKCEYDSASDATGTCTASDNSCSTYLEVPWGQYCNLGGSFTDWVDVGGDCNPGIELMCGVDSSTGLPNICDRDTEKCIAPYSKASGEACYTSDYCMKDDSSPEDNLYCYNMTCQNVIAIQTQAATKTCARSSRWSGNSDCSWDETCACTGGLPYCVPNDIYYSYDGYDEFRGYFETCYYNTFEDDYECRADEECFSDFSVPGTCCYNPHSYCAALNCGIEYARTVFTPLGLEDVLDDLIDCVFPSECSGSLVWVNALLLFLLF